MNTAAKCLRMCECVAEIVPLWQCLSRVNNNQLEKAEWNTNIHQYFLKRVLKITEELTRNILQQQAEP